jgi:hypothetical protein
MGRTLLFLAASSLLLSALLHGLDAATLNDWTGSLPERPRDVLHLVWITTAIDRAVVALIWAGAAWRRRRAWRRAAAIAALIPLAGGIGIVTLDVHFFGGYLLLATVGLALVGIRLMGGLRRDD